MFGEQNVASQAEHEIKKFEEITDVVAVNDNERILLAFKLKQFDKFRTKQIETKVNKKLKSSFSKHKSSASSDLKIFIETTKIKNKMKSATSDKDKMKKEMDKIIKLSQEQT